MRLRFPLSFLLPVVVAMAISESCPAQPAPHGVENDGRFTALKAFVSAPASVFPTIDNITRLDMIDYFNSGSPKASKTRFRSDCRILSASDMQVTVLTSDVSEVELSLIPEKSDTIIMVITTLKTPATDSSAKFYTRGWNEIDKGLFLVPTLSEWIAPDSKVPVEDIENAVPFILARLSYTPENGELTLTNNLNQFLPDDVIGTVGTGLNQKLTYRWNGKKMERVKK